MRSRLLAQARRGERGGEACGVGIGRRRSVEQTRPEGGEARARKFQRRNFLGPGVDQPRMIQTAPARMQISRGGSRDALGEPDRRQRQVRHARARPGVELAGIAPRGVGRSSRCAARDRGAGRRRTAREPAPPCPGRSACAGSRRRCRRSARAIAVRARRASPACRKPGPPSRAGTAFRRTAAPGASTAAIASRAAGFGEIVGVLARRAAARSEGSCRARSAAARSRWRDRPPCGRPCRRRSRGSASRTSTTAARIARR